MYTVLLVDDEVPILDSLSSSINWHQFGVSTLLTASDGIQALQIMSEQEVNLIITDIKMPNMDGLSLLKEVRSTYPDTHCILLTAYSEFEYAKTAIKLGVENYVLKPLNSKELEETIENTLNNIYINRKNTNQLFRQNILFRWVNGSITSDELSMRGSLLDINLYLAQYCTICIAPKETSTSLSAYCRQCIARLEETYEVYQLRDEYNRYLMIIGGSCIITEDLTKCFTEVAASLKISSQLVLSMGTIVYNANQLSSSYKSAVNLLNSLDFSGSEMFLLTAGSQYNIKLDILVQKIQSIFLQHNESTLLEDFRSIVQKALEMSESLSSVHVLKLLQDSLSRFFALEFPSFPDALNALHNRTQLFPAAADPPTSTDSAVELLNYSYILYCYYIGQFTPIIQAVINHIHQHYPQDISIQSFCSTVKVSSAYLGYLFKKETGIFFNDYLTQYRICNSIPLLLGTDMTINDIALQVGFSYPSYFISCFKKQTGVSPSKYRALQL